MLDHTVVYFWVDRFDYKTCPGCNWKCNVFSIAPLKAKPGKLMKPFPRHHKSTQIPRLKSPFSLHNVCCVASRYFSHNGCRVGPKYQNSFQGRRSRSRHSNWQLWLKGAINALVHAFGCCSYFFLVWCQCIKQSNSSDVLHTRKDPLLHP